MMPNRRVQVALGTMMVLGVCAMAAAQFAARRVLPGQPAGAGSVSLPRSMQDNGGTNWTVYAGGWFRINSNMPVYGQGAMITINGQGINQNANAGHLDAKTGELIIDENAAGCSVSRRILVDRAGSFLRYIDVFKNTQNQPQTFQVSFQTNINFGISATQTVPDPRKKDQNIGWVGQTMANSCAVELYAGKGAKIAPQIVWTGGNMLQANVSLTIPAGKEAAVMHVHAVSPTQDGGVKFITDFKDSAVIKSLPANLRRIIVNFRASQDFVGNLEILRGDLLDVVELHDGDAIKGTLKDTSYELTTFYGAVTLPVDKVIGLINVGQFRPRQLLVTSDGQIFGGRLKKQTLELQLSSGQVTQIPLSQVSRAGYRKRPGEPEEWTLDQPMVLMRTGERVAVELPAQPIEIATRYGKLLLEPRQMASVVLEGDDNAVHLITLADGSHFAGLLTAPMFEMKLAGENSSQTVHFPTGALGKIQFTAHVRESDDSTPWIRLSNDDELAGTLHGTLRLETAFDTIDINAGELKSLSHAPEGGVEDVQVTLWDGTAFSGQLQEQELSCQLLGGVTLSVPAALVRQYSQPFPQPSDELLKKIRNVVEKDLTNEDWHVRDRAREQLLEMGQVIAPVLKRLRENQPPEAQKTIDVILAELAKQRKSQSSSATTDPAAIAPFDQSGVQAD